MKPRRQRRCKVCLEKYTPTRPLQTVCPRFECAIQYGKRLKQKQAKREKRDGRVKLRTVSDWTKLAQDAFNRFIRERDKGQPCISCDTYGTDGEAFTGGYWDCGHFRTIGAEPALRFEELNAHRQCKSCNSGVHRHGKRVRAVHDPERYATIRAAYEARLIRRIGAAKVEWLKGPHEPKRYRIDELQAITKLYREKLRALRKVERAAA